jgi:hypothetical protein
LLGTRAKPALLVCGADVTVVAGVTGAKTADIEARDKKMADSAFGDRAFALTLVTPRGLRLIALGQTR